MKLQLASEMDRKHNPNTRQGRGNLERNHDENEQNKRRRNNTNE